MALDLTNEATLPLLHAAQLVRPGRNGKQTHLSTLIRWIVRGVRGPTGQVVRLEALRLGGRWVTSREALQRFAEALTPRLADAAQAPSRPTPRQRRRAAEQAGDELAARGV